MSRRLRNLKAAEEEFVSAVLWYEEQRPGLGGEFFDEVLLSTSFIEANPEAGTLLPDRRTRRVLVERFPYQIVYRLLEDEIVIVAIAHLKRRPNYWSKRK